MINNKFWLVLSGCVTFVVLSVLAFKAIPIKRPSIPPTAQQIAQKECAVQAYTYYIKTNLVLLQQQAAAPSVENTVAERRLQEQYCLQFARCLFPEPTSQLIALQHAIAFDGCLRDEVLEKYDAVPRADD
jgi:hypothetical protein